MKILVTGGAGFIGSNLVKRLLDEEHIVHSLDNYSTGNTKIKGCEYFEGDIEEIDTIHKDYDLIFHLAAQSRVQPSFENPTETFRVNVKGTEEVCKFASRIGAKVVYAGSSSKHHNPATSPYAMYKYLGEGVINLYKESFGLNAEICRFYNVYGPGEIVDGDWAAVIGKWRRQVRDGEPITIVGNGEQRRDFTYIDDIIDGLWKIGMKELTHEDAWELGTGMNYSINDVYLMFKERFGVDFINLPDQSGNYRATLRENDDSLDKLNWKPSDKLRDYILSLNKN